MCVGERGPVVFAVTDTHCIRFNFCTAGLSFSPALGTCAHFFKCNSLMKTSDSVLQLVVWKAFACFCENNTPYTTVHLFPNEAVSDWSDMHFWRRCAPTEICVLMQTALSWQGSACVINITWSRARDTSSLPRPPYRTNPNYKFITFPSGLTVNVHMWELAYGVFTFSANSCFTCFH